MPETYDVVDGKLKVITETTEAKEETYSLEELQGMKADIEKNMSNLSIGYAENKAKYQAELDNINALIKKAEELGVKAVIV